MVQKCDFARSSGVGIGKEGGRRKGEREGGREGGRGRARERERERERDGVCEREQEVQSKLLICTFKNVSYMYSTAVTH